MKKSPDEQAQIVNGFADSLQHLANTWGFIPCAGFDTLPFPYNIGNVLLKTRRQMAVLNPSLQLVFVHMWEEHTYRLALGKRKDPEYGTYYVPVRPLFYLMRSGKRKARTQLICCLYAYLLRVAKIPYCSDDQQSYISCEYDYMRELEEDGEPHEMTAYIKQIDSALVRCRRRFDQQRLLDTFAGTLEHFRPKTEADHTLYQIAMRFLELYETYPDRNFQQALLYDRDNDYYGEAPVEMDQIVSFIWSDGDMIAHYIYETLNAELSSGAEEASYVCAEVYDRTFPDKEGVDRAGEYMHHLLDAMSDLTVYMSRIDDEQRN